MKHAAEQTAEAKIIEIQVLRALAILLVLVAHLSITASLLMHLPVAVSNPGWVGVELFFVISGYVVAKSLLRSGFVVIPFVIRRLFRLYPLLVLFIGLFLLSNALAGWLAPGAPRLYVQPFGQQLEQAAAILLWAFPSAHSGMSYNNNAAWSLMVEFRFYAAIAVAVVALKVLRCPSADIKRMLLVLFGAAYLMGLLARMLLYFEVPLPGGSLIIGRMYDFLALGVVAGLMPDRVVERIGSVVKPYSWMIVAAALALTMFIGTPVALDPDAVRLRDSVGLAILGWLFVLLVAAAATGSRQYELPKLMRVWGNRIGDRSYALFLLHLPVFHAVWAVAQPLGMGGGYWQWPVFQLVISLIVLIPLVEAAYRLIEVPGIRTGKSLVAVWTGRVVDHDPLPWTVRLAAPLVAALSYHQFIVASIKAEFANRVVRSRLGAAWLILHPLSQATIFAVVLSSVLAPRLPGVPGATSYAVYVMAGMAAWHLFSEILTRSLTVLPDNASVLKKIAFPRGCLLLIVWGSALANHVLLLGAVAAVAIVCGHYPGAAWLALPLSAALISLFAFGIGILCGLFNVFSRDVGQVTGIVLQLWFWLTPIVYPVEALPAGLRWLADINPVYPLVRVYQDALLHDRWFEPASLALPAVLAAVLLSLACASMRRAMPDIVDAL